jgi:N-acetyl-gamma-glutamyl-phosphate reductase
MTTSAASTAPTAPHPCANSQPKSQIKGRSKPAIFIDGEAGTTGLEIRRRVADVAGIEVKSIPPAERKDPVARASLMREVDLVVLCLPDEAAREAVALIDQMGPAGPKVIDASTAHRVAPGWVYGFPEMDPAQTAAVRASRRVTNPGCYPTAAIALIRPLVEAGLLPADYPVTINAVSGYSGGGRSMIEAYQAGRAPSFELYGLTFEHKHLPELQEHAKLTRRPIFIPSVGNYRQGMLVSVPLHLDTLPGKPSARDLETALVKHYAGAKLVAVLPGDPDAKEERLEPEALNGTDMLELRVYASRRHPHALLVARLDNLGKGASGAAVASMKLMLGIAA